MTINEHTYYGPHKWIICLIGQDIYSINSFLIQKGKELKAMKSLSISVMGLCDRELTDSKDYRKLCQSHTREGVYMMVTKKDNFEGQNQEEPLKSSRRSDKTTFDELAQQFLSSIEVYPSATNHVFKEVFSV